MKVKIMTDTSCGISRKEAEFLGHELVALPFTLDEIEILDDDKKISVDDYAIDDGVIRDKDTYDAIIKLVDKERTVSEDQDIIFKD